MWIVIALGIVAAVILYAASRPQNARKPTDGVASPSGRAPRSRPKFDPTYGGVQSRAPALKTVALDFVALDTETTGLTDEDRIVTFAAAHVKGGEVVATIHLCFNPERNSAPQAARVHGWADEDLAIQPLLKDHVGEIVDFLRRAPVLVAHNMAFDSRMLRNAHPDINAALNTVRFACTMKYAQQRLDTHNHKLDTCLASYDLKRSGSLHNALEDVMLVASLTRCLAQHGPLELPQFSPVPTNIRQPLPSGRYL